MRRSWPTKDRRKNNLAECRRTAFPGPLQIGRADHGYMVPEPVLQLNAEVNLRPAPSCDRCPDQGPLKQPPCLMPGFSGPHLIDSHLFRQDNQTLMDFHSDRQIRSSDRPGEHRYESRLYG